MYLNLFASGLKSFKPFKKLLTAVRPKVKPVAHKVCKLLVAAHGVTNEVGFCLPKQMLDLVARR